MGRRNTDTGISDNADSGDNNIINVKSNTNQKIEVELNSTLSFICYPYTTGTIDEIHLNKIQEYLDKGLLVRI